MNKYKLLKSFKNKRILITGNTGFVGSYLCLTLKLFGARILGFSKKMKDKNYISNNKNFIKCFETIYDDIENINIYKKKIINFKPHIIIHLASQPIVKDSYVKTYSTYKTNVMGIVKLMEVAKDLKLTRNIVVFTSDKVYLDKGNTQLNEKSYIGGEDPYSSSKSSQDIISNSYKLSFFKKSKNIIIIRAGNIIGGGDFQKTRLIPDIYLNGYKNKKIKIRNPFAIRPWQHILDVISGLLSIISLKQKKIEKKSLIFNISPISTPNLSVIKLLKKITILNKNKTLKISTMKIKFNETKVLKISSKKIFNLIKWRPRLTLNKSIILTDDWYKNIILEKKKDNLNFTLNQIKRYYNL